MPELPEVETLVSGLNEILPLGQTRIEKVELGGRQLRSPFRRKQIKLSHGFSIDNVRRIAKYLVFDLNNGDCFLSHLGMTGSWRMDKVKDKHDHVRIFLSDGRILCYRDPRRFGQFDIIKSSELLMDKRFSHLGPNPLDREIFTWKYLKSRAQGRKTPIKNLIMNQEVVVGVGNIYASEALYLCGILPNTVSKDLNNKNLQDLVEAIYQTLWDAILCGGTTISDFRQAGGSSGYFQNLLFVYGRDGEECLFCKGTIQSLVMAGRNTFWCPDCQTQ